MWLISLLIVIPVGWLSLGREVPAEVLDVLQSELLRPSTPSAHVLAYSFVAGLFVGGTPLHVLLRYFATLVHELGHAFTAGILGGRPRQIEIHPSSSGLATYRPPLGWGRGRASLVALAGYPSPAIAALAAVQAVLMGFTSLWFFYGAATLSIALVFLIRNVWGFLWTAGVVVGSYYIATELPAEALFWVVGSSAGYLAVESLRHASRQIVIAKHFRGSGCDAELVGSWWSISPRRVALIQFVFTAVIAGIAGFKAIEPNWTEMIETFRRWTN